MLALMAMAIWMVQGTIATSQVVQNITTSAKNRIVRDASAYTEAAIAEARTRLKGRPTSNPSFLGDQNAAANDYLSSTPSLNWSAYLLTSSSWQPTNDPEYDASLTNYVPTSSVPTNTAITVNSVQQTFPYWIKLKHKHEYDAELSGHRLATAHYTDNDGSTALHTSASRGNIVYYGYLSKTSTIPVQFTTGGTTNWPQIEVAKIYSEGNGTIQKIQAEVVRDVGPPFPGAIYSKGNVNFMVAPDAVTRVDGSDAESLVPSCNMTPARPPVYILDPGTMNGTAVYAGNPAAPSAGTINIDIAQWIQKYQTGATKLDADVTNANYGSASSYVTVYSNTSGPVNVGGLKLRDVTGYGLLLVDGDVILEEDVYWYGLILATGNVQFKSASVGGALDIVVEGGILAGSVTAINKGFRVSYNSCQIARAMGTKPAKLIGWRRL